MRAAVINIGCRLNQSEGDSLRQYLVRQGCSVENVKERDKGEGIRDKAGISPFALRPSPSSLELVIVNTCCVTREAERSSINRIRQVTRMTPKPYLIVTGCMAEHDPERVARIAGVDKVLGIAEKERLIANVPVLPDRSRAFLKVQDGCDNHCRYCIASRLRPAPKSRPVDQVFREAAALLAAGFHEIVLVGLNLGSYGLDIGISLAELLRTLARDSERDLTPSPLSTSFILHPSSFLLRLSSLEPDTLTDELVETLAALSGPGVPASEKEKGERRKEKVRNSSLIPSPLSFPAVLCPHFHISLQSGDDGLLQAMGRRYRAAEYRAVVERVLKRIPDANIGTDVIVGFPGEDDAAFRNTLRLVEDFPFGYLHVFTYSPRPGTEAFASGDPVPKSVKKERVGLLRQLSTEKSLTYRRRFTGLVRPAILQVRTAGFRPNDQGSGIRDQGSEFPSRPPAPDPRPVSVMVTALTDNYIPVRLRDQALDERRMVEVRIDRVDVRGASGSLVG